MGNKKKHVHLRDYSILTPETIARLLVNVLRGQIVAAQVIKGEEDTMKYAQSAYGATQNILEEFLPIFETESGLALLDETAEREGMSIFWENLLNYIPDYVLENNSREYMAK